MSQPHNAFYYTPPFFFGAQASYVVQNWFIPTSSQFKQQLNEGCVNFIPNISISFGSAKNGTIVFLHFEAAAKLRCSNTARNPEPNREAPQCASELRGAQLSTRDFDISNLDQDTLC